MRTYQLSPIWEDKPVEEASGNKDNSLVENLRLLCQVLRLLIQHPGIIKW